MNELRKLLDDFDDDVAVALSDTKIRFDIADTVLTTKLVDGTFPDYERVIPTGNDNIVTVPNRTFKDAVDRVSTISPDKARAIKFSIDGDRMTLSAHNPGQASASEEVEIEYGGAAMDIGFNPRYVLDMAQQVEGDSLRFAISDPASPALVSDCDDSAALYVLMPMKV